VRGGLKYAGDLSRKEETGRQIRRPIPSTLLFVFVFFLPLGNPLVLFARLRYFEGHQDSSKLPHLRSWRWVSVWDASDWLASSSQVERVLPDRNQQHDARGISKWYTSTGSQSALSPLPSPSEEDITSYRQPHPKRIVCSFCRTLETHLHNNRSFCFFLFSAISLLAALCWLLGTSERIHLCFFFHSNSGRRPSLRLETVVARQWKSVKRGDNNEEKQIPTPQAGATSFRLFAAVQIITHLLHETSLHNFLC